MGFFPNAELPPTYQGQSVADATDFQAIAGATQQTGVASGCLVTAGSGNSVNVASGVIVSGGAFANVSGATNLAGYSSSSVGDRVDIVVASSSGVLSVIQAPTTSAIANWLPNLGPLPPVKAALPSGSVLLASIYYPANLSGLGALWDKRLFVNFGHGIPNSLTLTANTATVTPQCGGGGSTVYDLNIFSTNLTAVTIANVGGTPSEGQKLTFRITTTAAIPITWGSAYEGSAFGPLPGSTFGARTDKFGFEYRNSSSTWDMMAYIPGFV